MVSVWFVPTWQKPKIFFFHVKEKHDHIDLKKIPDLWCFCPPQIPYFRTNRNALVNLKKATRLKAVVSSQLAK